MKNLTALLTVLILSLVCSAQNPGDLIDYYKINSVNDTTLSDTNILEIGSYIANIGDLDGDGVVDIATRIRYPKSEPVFGAFSILFINTDGSVKSKSLITKNQGGLNSAFSDSIVSIKWSCANLGDVDGDKVQDIAVNIETTEGNEVVILFMNTDGTVKSHYRIGENKGGFNTSLPADNSFGAGLAGIDDLDGDGIGELMVGDPYGTGNEKGTLYILYLRNTGEVKDYKKINAVEGGFTGDLTDNDNFGNSIASLGNRRVAVGADGTPSPSRLVRPGGVWIIDLDINGKVTNQILIAEKRGGFSDTSINTAHFGGSVDSIGDINGDGINDLVVGAPFWMEAGFKIYGATFILMLNQDGSVKAHKRYSNSSGKLPYTLDENDFFGTGVAGLGDIDGDGKYDIAVGASGIDASLVYNKGEIHILFLDGFKVGIPKLAQEKIKVYPNPANNSITISNDVITNGNYTVAIYDVAGRLVANLKHNGSQPIDISSYDNGVYHVMVTSCNSVYQGRFIVQR